MKKDKIVRDLKLYNLIMSNIWQFITTALLGVLAGYLLKRNAKEEDNHYMLICVIIFIVVGAINFFVGIFRQLRKIEKAEKAKQEIINNSIEEIVEEDHFENEETQSEIDKPSDSDHDSQ